MKLNNRHHRPFFSALEPRLLLAALTDVPQLSSHPSSTAKIYLDFNGDAAQTWGSYNVTATPAYDTDGNKTAFSDAELTNITEIWKRVSEKYSPFNIDVTTIEPASFANKVAVRIVIGGNGSWLGNYGGVSYVGSFYNSAPNVCFVFEDNLGNGAPKYTAEAAAHEAGHAFGLGHQKQYSSSGALLNEYNPGNTLIAPTMGNSYYAARGLWFYGPSNSPTSYQDDMSILANDSNGFGYRTDDYTAPSVLTQDSNNAISASGVIEKTSDTDSFTFTTGAGAISLVANVAQYGAMLNLKITLKDAGGNAIASSDTSSLGETLSTTVAAGTYTLTIASHGGYGDVGQYSLCGTLLPAENPQGNTDDNTDDNTDNNDNDTPQETLTLAASGLSTSQIQLTWNDLTSETGYILQRSSDNSTWSNIATLNSDVTAYTNSSLAQNKTWYYRLIALSGDAALITSNSAFAKTLKLTVPAAPSHLTATAAKNKIIFNWTDNSDNESGFYFQRSTNGKTWTTIGVVPANYTSCYYSIISKTAYYYRVMAYNAAGKSSASSISSAVKSIAKSTKTIVKKSIFYSEKPIFETLQ